MSSFEELDAFPVNDSLGFGQHALPEEWPAAQDGLEFKGPQNDFRLTGDVANGTLRAYRPAQNYPATGHLYLEFDFGELSPDGANTDKPSGAWVQSRRHVTESQQLPQRTIEGEQ